MRGMPGDSAIRKAIPEDRWVVMLTTVAIGSTCHQHQICRVNFTYQTCLQGELVELGYVTLQQFHCKFIQVKFAMTISRKIKLAANVHAVQLK
ncbi:hypothetical protein AVEN_45826-1 [Araneus ventricosus]|uniref:Uncharacterized protein n=1 Tax=Araneus ventricosus TaxID=182803 RepID=A0A4Y2J5U5_ARAVE|nr:hypothetical protein AVEN_45826-1 [Araneus ventricosus]